MTATLHNKARAHTDFVHSRAVPDSWQRELEAIVPRSDRLSWLKLAWYPGIFYQPVGRWVIYEMEPNLERVAPDMLADIRGPSPRTRGDWVVDHDIPEHLGGKRWESHSLHSTTAWELHKETGCYPLLFWIIQGDAGGHVWRMDRIKRRFALAIEGADVPLPGELPYAPWDKRVASQITRYDRLRTWHEHMMTPWGERTTSKNAAGLWVTREAYATEQEYTNEMLKFLDGQISDALRDIPRTMLPDASDLPVIPDVDPSQGIEQSTANLLKSTGHAPFEE